MTYIKARNLFVDFPVRYHQNLRSWLKRDNHFRALNDISFDAFEGHKVGLIGPNGAGKTTFLRTIAGVYSLTSGELSISGRIRNLTNINAGLNNNATGLENIKLRSLYMGLTPKITRDFIEDVVEFSNLGEALERKLHTYSSGMRARLAFSMATHFEADIILLDEWIGVADARFRDRANERIDKLVSNCGILIIASHNKSIINKHTNRTLNFLEGQIVDRDNNEQANQ